MDWTALNLWLRLGIVTVVLLLPVAFLLARALAFGRWRGRGLVGALVALPLILPPTVIGYYLLVSFGRASPLGAAFESAFGRPLASDIEARVEGFGDGAVAPVPPRHVFAGTPLVLFGETSGKGEGRLHLQWSDRGGLFNHIFAKHHHGIFILRIEYTDIERSTETSIDAIFEDLKWLGIRWEEGPDQGGPEGPYRQSQRLSLYRGYADQLLKEGRAYKCFCSPERLESLRKEQLSKGKMPRYDGRCRSLSENEISKMESEGQPPVLRFHVKRGSIAFEDLVQGRMTFDAEGIGDFIIVRSDGMAAYNFACVIDDTLMHVSHVIRGDDHLSNTPRQILLYQALSWKPPDFAHHPLILGSDRSPLSKRHGATAVSQYREEGFLPEALLNYLVLLGWTSRSGEEVLPLEKIIEEFSLPAISRSAPVHSLKKLEWLNSIYIRQKDEPSLTRLLVPYLETAGIPVNAIDQDYLKQVTVILKENLVVLSQVAGYLGIFFDEKFFFEDGAKTIFADSGNRETLRQVLQAVESSSEITIDTWPSLHAQLENRTGRKGKDLFAPFRAAVTGKTKGPELAKTLPLLGKERIIRRLRMALETT